MDWIHLVNCYTMTQCCQLFDQKSELLYVKNPATFFLVNVLKYAWEKILKLPYLYIIISNNFKIKKKFLEFSDKILKFGSTGYVTYYGTLGSVGKTILPPVYAG